MGRKWSDNARAALAGNLTTSSTTLQVASGKGALFKTITGRGAAGSATDWFVITIRDATGNIEKIKVEHHAAASDTLGSAGYPLVRGYDGTSAKNWTAASTTIVSMPVDKSAMESAFDAASGVALGFGLRDSSTSGLNLAYSGACISVDGVLTTVAAGSIALADSTTNYVERDSAGTVYATASAFTAGRVPLYEVVTLGGEILSITDRRGWSPDAGKLTRSVAGAANVTLTAAEYRNQIMEFNGLLTGSISVTVPAMKRYFAIHNNTTGAFSLTIKTAGGAGVSVAQGKRVLVYSDGVDVLPLFDAFGTAAALDVGTASGNVVQLATGGKLPAVDASLLTNVPVQFALVRQTALSGPVDSNGAASFGGTGGSSTLTATGTIKATAANGAVDYTGSITAPVWNSPVGGGTGYLYLDIAADGTVTTGVATSAPVQQWGNGSISTAAGAHTYVIAEGKMYLGNGGGTTNPVRVFVGECPYAAGVWSGSPTWYALNGNSVCPRVGIPAASTRTAFAHNIGVDPQFVTVKAWVRFVTSWNGYAAGMVIPWTSYYVGTNPPPLDYNVNESRLTAAVLNNSSGMQVPTPESAPASYIPLPTGSGTAELFVTAKRNF